MEEQKLSALQIELAERLHMLHHYKDPAYWEPIAKVLQYQTTVPASQPPAGYVRLENVENAVLIVLKSNPDLFSEWAVDKAVSDVMTRIRPKQPTLEERIAKHISDQLGYRDTAHLLVSELTRSIMAEFAKEDHGPIALNKRPKNTEHAQATPIYNEVEISWREGKVLAGPFIYEHAFWEPEQAEHFADCLKLAASSARKQAENH